VARESGGRVSLSGGDAGSLQGESLITLNKALADATARLTEMYGAFGPVLPAQRKPRAKKALAS